VNASSAGFELAYIWPGSGALQPTATAGAGLVTVRLQGPDTPAANITVDHWWDTGLVFTAQLGAALDAGNVRKMFKRVCKEAGIGDGWTPRELRTSFVSLMSLRGVSVEEIARLVGHASTRTTELVCRRELRPVITTGAEIMDELFGR
jgi:integrase